MRSDSFTLYCVDPTDGHGKFQIVSPHRAGPKVLPDDKRRTLSNLVLKVDHKAAPFRERLQLDVSIDDNLVLHAKGRSLNQRGMAEAEIHDLEFALALPSGKRGWLRATHLHESTEQGAKHDTGDLVMRSNLAAHEDDRLVPGEVLYRFDPLYFRYAPRAAASAGGRAPLL